MNLNRSGLSACVIAGLENAREYSYLGKALYFDQGRCDTQHFLSRFSNQMISAFDYIRVSDSFIHICETH